MRLNEQEIKMFDGLRKSSLGKELAEYIERLEGEVHDSRNWDEGMTRETAQLASKPLREFRSHLKTSVGDEKNNPNEFI